MIALKLNDIAQHIKLPQKTRVVSTLGMKGKYMLIQENNTLKLSQIVKNTLTINILLLNLTFFFINIKKILIFSYHLR